MNAIEMVGEIGENAELRGAVIYLVSSGQLEAMTSELVMKYPSARSFVESVASFASLEEAEEEIQDVNGREHRTQHIHITRLGCI